MFDVGLLKGVNVVLLRSVTVKLAELWRVAGRRVWERGGRGGGCKKRELCLLD